MLKLSMLTLLPAAAVFLAASVEADFGGHDIFTSLAQEPILRNCISDEIFLLG
jgi:hypothetical protein